MDYQVIELNDMSLDDIIKTIRPLIHYKIKPGLRGRVALKLIKQGKQILVNSNGYLIVLEFDQSG